MRQITKAFLFFRLSDSKILLDLYVKSTERQQFLHYTLTHSDPDEVFYPFGQGLRPSMISSDISDFLTWLVMVLEFHFSRVFQNFRFKKHIIFPEHDLILILFFLKLNDCFSISSYIAKTNVAIFRSYFLTLNDNHEFDNPLK